MDIKKPALNSAHSDRQKWTRWDPTRTIKASKGNPGISIIAETKSPWNKIKNSEEIRILKYGPANNF